MTRSVSCCSEFREGDLLQAVSNSEKLRLKESEAGALEDPPHVENTGSTKNIHVYLFVDFYLSNLI